MRLSHMFGRTLYEAPAEAEWISHQLALRAGLVRSLAPGVFAYLPPGWQALARIAAFFREEMDALCAQEILLPASWTPAAGDAPAGDFEAETWQPADPAEVVIELTRRDVRSYRQLPSLLYHVQARMSGEPRPGGGFMRLRQFLTAEAFSLDADHPGLEAAYAQVSEACRIVFARCEVELDEVEVGDGLAFVVPHPQGEDTIICCPGCGYAAPIEYAAFEKQLVAATQVALEPVVEVATPGCETIAQLAEFLGLPTSQTLKGVFYAAGGRLVVVAIRGDLEVNEAKLARVLGLEGPQFTAPLSPSPRRKGVGRLSPADADTIRAAGIEPGYGSPVGRPVAGAPDGEGMIVVADDSVPAARNLVAGANRPGYHLTGVNFGRDWTATLVADIALARAGDLCARCRTALAPEPGVVLGGCTQLGTRLSESMEAPRYLDETGRPHPILVGRYAIQLDRLLAAVLERHHDERGIVWPREVAPFDVHLLTLGADPEVHAAGTATYEQLQAAGLSVLYDDRNESAGVKFADADLIGLPVRVTVSRRSLKEGGAEVKPRTAQQAQVIALAELGEAVARI